LILEIPVLPVTQSCLTPLPPEAGPALAGACLTPLPSEVHQWCDAIERACSIHSVLHDGRFGTKTHDLFKILSEAPPAQRKLIEAMYREHYGRDLTLDLQRHLYGVKERQALKLLAVSDLEAVAGESIQKNSIPHDPLPVSTAARRLFHVLSKKRVSETDLFHLLRDKSAAQIVEISRVMQKKFGQTLESLIERRLSGRSRNNARLALQGAPADPGSFLGQVKQAADFERKGLAGWVTWHLTPTGWRLRRSLAKAQGANSSSSNTSREKTALALRITRFAAQDLGSFARRKARNASIMAALSSAVTAIGVMTAMSTAPVWAAAGCAAVTGALAYTAGKVLAFGRTYDRRTLLRDTTSGAIEAAITVAFSLPGAMAQAAARQAGKQTLQRMLEQSVKKGVGGVIQDASGGIAVRSGLSSGIGSALGAIIIRLAKRSTWELGVEEAFKNIAQVALSSAVTGATGSAAKTAIKEMTLPTAPAAEELFDCDNALEDLMMGEDWGD
jgi:hypothetical protein